MRTILIATMALTACAGADGTNGEDGSDGRDGESPEISTRAASEDDCPEGGTEIELDGETVVLCNGEDGEDGEPGEDGMDGETGPAGADGEPAAAGDSIGVIELSLYCGAVVEDTDFFVMYNLAQFTDGSLWVSGSVHTPSIGASASKFYAPGQVGSETGGLTVSIDVAGYLNAGFWSIDLDRDELTLFLTYTDPDVADGQLVWTLPASSNGCVVN